jgi:hypothetical protein
MRVRCVATALTAVVVKPAADSRLRHLERLTAQVAPSHDLVRGAIQVETLEGGRLRTARGSAMIGTGDTRQR